MRVDHPLPLGQCGVYATLALQDGDIVLPADESNKYVVLYFPNKQHCSVLQGAGRPILPGIMSCRAASEMRAGAGARAGDLVLAWAVPVCKQAASSSATG